MTTEQRVVSSLRQNGLRATRGRIALLRVLGGIDRPESIGYILRKLSGKFDQASVYRALEALSRVGIVRRVDLGHGHKDYELAGEDGHHHHLICKKCGMVEDIERCFAGDIEQDVLKTSRKFSTIETHALEFFGICKKCVSVSS